MLFTMAKSLGGVVQQVRNCGAVATWEANFRAWTGARCEIREWRLSVAAIADADDRHQCVGGLAAPRQLCVVMRARTPAFLKPLTHPKRHRSNVAPADEELASVGVRESGSYLRPPSAQPGHRCLTAGGRRHHSMRDGCLQLSRPLAARGHYLHEILCAAHHRLIRPQKP